MSVENNNPPEGDGSSGGANGQNGQQQDQQPTTVAYDTHRRLLDEKKKVQKRADDAEAKLKEIEDEKLKASGDYQKMLDAEKERNRILAEENASHKKVRQDARKMNAFLKAVGSTLDDKWLRQIDLEKISFLEGTDEVDQMSVTTQVNNFKQEWPEAFRSNSAMPPANAPDGKVTKLTRADFAKLPPKEQRKYKPSDILDD
jgi:hypothetical protein